MPYSATLIQAKSRTERTELITAPEGQADVESPAYECLSYRAQLPDVEMMRAVHGGTKTMRAMGEEFLPKHPMEQDKKYEVRRKQAVAFNAHDRTVDGLVGMIFRREPKLSEDMDSSISGRMANIDARGQKLSMFGRMLAENALVDGHTWIHVEAPRTDPNRRTRADEDESDLPYWINVKKSQAINWRYEMRGGRPTLTLFVYREGASEPAGAFGEKSLERIRVLREVRGGTEAAAVSQIQGELWELREKKEAKQGEATKEWVMVEGPYVIDSDTVPVVIVYADRAGIFVSNPPLRDLGYEQIEHYRVRSDRQKSMTFASIAVPYLFGKEVLDTEGNTKVKWSSDTMMCLNDPDAEAGMIESQGFGLEATKAELGDIEGRMAALGLQMLVRPRGVNPETATSEIMGKSESDAALVLFADSLEGAMNEALKVHASYSAASPTPGTIELNRDFHDKLLSPQQFDMILKARAEREISHELFFEMLKAGEILPEDFDIEVEQERLQAEDARRLELVEAGMGGADDDEGEEDAA